MDFSHILQWRLLSGSHEFPGPDGGTCVNEAAMVAAGYEYHKIKRENDCPPCFCRVIAAYTIRLNDLMPNDLRQKLFLPLVTRLAGTADPGRQVARASHLTIQTVRRILPIALRIYGRESAAQLCENVETLTDATGATLVVSNTEGEVERLHRASNAIYDATYCVTYAVDACGRAADSVIRNTPIAAAGYAAEAARKTANFIIALTGNNVIPDLSEVVIDPAAKKVFEVAACILDEAIKLGKEASDVDIELVRNRMEAVKLVSA